MFLLWCMTILASSCLAEPEIASSSGVIEVIKRLGDNRAGDIQVTQGQNKVGESPIFFIKLPPSPYYFKANSVPAPFRKLQKLPVSFLNNGRPHKIHHWNIGHALPHTLSPRIPTTTPQRPPTTSQPQRPPTTSQPQRPPTTTPVPTTTTSVPRGPSKTWVHLKKGFAYNGRPSSVYVWPSKVPAKVVRRRPAEGRPRVNWKPELGP